MEINIFDAQLAESFSARFSIDRLSMPMADWITANTKIGGQPFTFDRYPFQREIASDTHPQLACMKISQVGLTEVQMRKCCGLLVRNKGTKALFTQPNIAMQKKIAQTRFKPLIEGNPVFNAETDLEQARSMFLYQFGESFLHITAATEGDATGTPGDFLFNDEVDLTDQEMLALFQSRLQNSDYKMTQTFSTPTFLGYGIDQLYTVSDQREFKRKCLRCNTWQVPIFTPDFVRFKGLPDHIEHFDQIDDRIAELLDLDAAVHCSNCERPLDLTDYSPGVVEWVARHPGRASHGYRVRPFSTERISVRYIVEQLLFQKRVGKVRRWHNTVLGDPYTGADEQLSFEDIRAALGDPRTQSVPPGTPIFVGIDSGMTCHLKAMTDHGVFLVVEVPAERLPDYVKELSERYRILAGAMDRHPQSVLAGMVWEASGRTIWPTEYRGTKTLHPVKDVAGEVTHFQCDRTAMLDAFASRIRARSLPITGYGHLKETIETHLRNMVREEEPEKPAVWKKLAAEDHFFHAGGFMLLARQIADALDLINKIETRASVVLQAVPTPIPASMLAMRRPKNINASGLGAFASGPFG